MFQLSWYMMDLTHHWSSLMTDDMIAAKPLAHEIDSPLSPSETFFLWGGNPYERYSLSGQSRQRTIPPSCSRGGALEGRLHDTSK